MRWQDSKNEQLHTLKKKRQKQTTGVPDIEVTTVQVIKDKIINFHRKLESEKKMKYVELKKDNKHNKEPNKSVQQQIRYNKEY